jgi:hypothetical protein
MPLLMCKCDVGAIDGYEQPYALIDAEAENEQLYALIDAKVGILIYFLF